MSQAGGKTSNITSGASGSFRSPPTWVLSMGCPGAAERSQDTARLHPEHPSIPRAALSCLVGMPRSSSVYKRTGMPLHVHLPLHTRTVTVTLPDIIPNPDTISANVQDSSLNFYSSPGQQLQAKESQDTTSHHPSLSSSGDSVT